MAGAEHFFKTLDQDKLYEVDLQTKAYAFALAEKLGIGSHKIAVNLLPMSLVKVRGGRVSGGANQTTRASAGAGGHRSN